MVKQRDQAKDSLEILHALIDSNMLARAAKTKDSLRVSHPEWTDDSSFYNSIMYDTIVYFGSDKMQSLVKYHNAMRNRYDSLEIELNKLGS